MGHSFWVTYGGIAVTNSHVFVTDQATLGPGQLPSGIVRLGLSSFTAIRFADESDYIDLTFGGDGMLYASFPRGLLGALAPTCGTRRR